MKEDPDIHEAPMNKSQLFADQVDRQYEHTYFGVAATLINSIILTFVL